MIESRSFLKKGKGLDLYVCFYQQQPLRLYLNMKLKLAFLLIGLLSLVSCSGNSNDNDEPASEGTITCNPTEIDATPAQGTYTINVTTTNSEWTAYTSDSWIAVKVSGSNSKSGTVSVTVSANSGTSSRTGSVVVKSGTTLRQTVTIKQSAPLSASVSKLDMLSAGETQTVTVSGESGWKVTSSADWLTVQKKDDNGFSVTAAANTNLVSRSGKVTITSASGSESVAIDVSQESASQTAIDVPSGYQLVWNDEFDSGTTLSSDWTHEVQPSGWVNNELQNYVNNSDVTKISDGKLNIVCYKGTDGKIYSGRVYAKMNTGWKYGYFEARIKLPQGKGTWPAFWMMPANNNFTTNPWPACGEIDIMEEVGADANTVASTIHCTKYNNGNTATEHGSKSVSTAESEYHVYACEWTSEFIRFMVDGVQILKYNNEGTKEAWPFNTAFYPILNLAWGGSWGGYKGVDESALPATMKVDYVRVFQKK